MKISQRFKEITAVILAAGKGERMKPFSLSKSKEMIEFLGRPLLAYHIDEMLRNGLDDFLIVSHQSNCQEMREYFKKHYQRTKIRFAIVKKQKGPSCALYQARSSLSKDWCLLKYGDSLAQEDQVQKILDKFREDSQVEAVATLRKVKQPQEYGIAKFKRGRLVAIVEKPHKNIPSHLANVGLCLLETNTFLKACDKYGFKEVIPPVEYILRHKGRVSYWISQGKRVDVGRPHDIVKANQLLMKKMSLKPGDSSVQAILFDADNTLYKTKETAQPATMKAMEFFSGQSRYEAKFLYDQWEGIVNPLISNQDPQKRSRSYSFNLLAKKFKLKGVDQALGLFSKELIKRIKKMEYLDKTLDKLKGYILILLTEDSRDQLTAKLEKLGLLKKFHLAVTADDVGIMKPNEKYYQLVFEKFGLSPDQCLVIGDNFEKDLEIPQKMGATVISFGQKHAQADYSIESWQQLSKILRS